MEARLNETKTAQTSSEPSPTDTPEPVPTSAPILAPTPEPAPTDTPTLIPTASPVPIPTPTPNPSNRQDEIARLQGLTLEELAAEIRARNAKLELERANGEEQVATPTPIPEDGRYTLVVDPGGDGDFTGKIVRFKIGDSYAAETASWEGGGATDLSLSVESLRDSNGAATQKVPTSYTPPHLFTGKASLGGNSVPLGTTISAWVDGLQVANTTTVKERTVSGMSGTGEIFSPLSNTLQMVWHLTNSLWAFYAPDFASLGINTYSGPSDGDIVWVSMNSNQNFQNQLLYEGWNLISLENSVTTATSSVAPEPSVATSFGDGTWVIGNDIQAGTYRSSKTGNSCYWERLSGFSGELDDIIANGVTDAIWVVEIASTDAGFSTERCGTWTEATSATTSSLTSPFGDGVFLVGMDISPGTWKSPGGDYCYWARLSGFSGELGHIKTNGAGGSNNILTIEPADKGFESSNCGTWTKTG